MVAAIAVGTTAGYGMLHLHKAPPVKKPPLQEIMFQEQDDGLSHLVGKDLAPYWGETRTADPSFQGIRDGVLLFVDPACDACDPVYPVALQVQEELPVFLAVDHPPSADLDNYLAYFGAGDLPVLHETLELRRGLPVDYWPTAVLVRDGRVAAAGNGRVTVSHILTEALQDSGRSHEPLK